MPRTQNERRKLFIPKKEATLETSVKRDQFKRRSKKATRPGFIIEVFTQVYIK